MTTYPKLPNGPSAQGAAAARAIDGGYQIKFAADYVAKNRGTFSRVEATGGYPYNTQGVYQTGVTSTSFIASSYKAKFTKTSAVLATIDCDFGKTVSTSITTSYYYTYYLGTHSIKYKGKVIDSFPVRLTITEGNALTPATQYLGRVKASDGRSAVALGTVTTKDMGRVDSYSGVPMADPVIHRTYLFADNTAAYDETTLSVPLPTTSDWFMSPRAISSTGVIYVILALARYGGGTPTATAPVYLCTSNDIGYTWNYTDISAYAFSDFPLTNYSVLNAAVAIAMLNMRLVMMDGGEAVIAFPRKTAAGTYGSRVVKLSGLSATTIYDGSPGALVPYAASLVYAGKDVLLMKRNLGVNGTGFATDFMVSYDRGTTWANITPVGFDAPLFNQYFGDLKVDMPVSDSKNARILINSWNPADSSYYTYVTTDYGQSWTRAALITKSDVFRRIDSTFSGDGGGNFRTLNIFNTANNHRAVDVAVPKRYSRSAA